MHTNPLTVALLTALLAVASPAAVSAQPKPAEPAKRPARPTPPARDPHTPGYVEAVELPDGEVPPADKEGNFIVGPTRKKAPEMIKQDGVPQGDVHELTMRSEDSKI